MKRFIINFLLTSVIIILTPFSACAQEALDPKEYENVLSSFDLSAFQELDDDTYDFLEELGIEDFDYESITSISLKSVMSHLGDLLMKRADGPLKSGITVVCFVILSSLFKSMNTQLNAQGLLSVYSTVSSLAISIFLTVKISSCVLLSAETIRLCANFSFAFFPAFCIIVATSGSPATSLSANTMLLTLAQGLNYITEYLFLPLTNCFLALGICSGLRQELNIASVINSLRKLITALISTFSGLFVSILSIKTAVSSRADALGLRSMRFAVNSVVPVIGGTISEGLLSIQSYSSLIKSGVGVVGIIAVAAIFLPALIEVNLWRGVLSLSCICADAFGDKSSVSAIRTFSNTLLILDVILILSMVTTIISLGILVAAKTVA